MDRFQDIKKRTYFGKKPVVGDEVAWLVQELVRARRNEDKALELLAAYNARPPEDGPKALSEALRQTDARAKARFDLFASLEANPRPDE